MDSSIHRSKAVRTTLAVVVLLFFPFLGFRLANGLSQAYSEGAFVNWHSLGKPSWSVVDIMGGDPWTVWLQADDGQTYEGNIEECKNPATGCWKKSEIVDDYYPSEKGFECQSSFKGIKSAPLRVTQCLRVVDLGGEWFGETQYALLQDGSVWYWKHSVSGLGPYGLIGMHGALLCGGISTGLFVGLILFLYLQRPRKVLIAP